MERVTAKKYNATNAASYHYNGDRNLAKHTDLLGNRRYTYEYDTLSRISIDQSNSNGYNLIRSFYSYDDEGHLNSEAIATNLSSLIEKSLFEYSYTYNPDGALGSAAIKETWVPGLVMASSIISGLDTINAIHYVENNLFNSNLSNTNQFSYTYDALKRLENKTLAVGHIPAPLYNEHYSYAAGAGTNATTTLVSSVSPSTSSGNNNYNYSYTYDAVGNITKEQLGGTRATYDTSVSSHTSNYTSNYTYDTQNQLTSETKSSLGYSASYTYDTFGNIRNKSVTTGDSTTSHTYTYGDSGWLDLLTTYDGVPIYYDPWGNPLSYRGMDFVWQYGNQLVQIYNVSTYDYSEDGLRFGKHVGNTESKYGYSDGRLIYEYRTTQNGNTSSVTNLHFLYDESGEPLGFSVDDETDDRKFYYYVKNLQGDITAILDDSGVIVGVYEYNAWGEILRISGDIAELNPLRYRGYYYDDETGFYYLRSRYYDPVVGRFISPDSYASTGQGFLGLNMFAYCLNNPVGYIDSNGNMPQWLKKAAALAAGAVATAAAAAAVIAVAPATFCAATLALTWVGISYEAAATITTVGILAVGTNTTLFAADVGYSAVAGESPVKEIIFANNESSYQAWQAVSAGVATGYMGAASYGAQIGVCFIAGTAVKTEDGAIPIEEIEVGDYVWAWDEITEDITLKPVLETYINETEELIHIYAGGEEIVTTPSHPFYVPNGGWTAAVSLRAGDILVTVNGESVIVEKVQHELLEMPITVYNFQVGDYHTYFVGNCAVLVHNSCGTPNSSTPWNIKQGTKPVQYI